MKVIELNQVDLAKCETYAASILDDMYDIFGYYHYQLGKWSDVDYETDNVWRPINPIAHLDASLVASAMLGDPEAEYRVIRRIFADCVLH